jgi:hypothetical protein
MPIGHLTQIPPGTPPPVPPPVPKKYFLGGAGFPFFIFLVFGLIYLAASLYVKPAVVVIANENIKSIFTGYAPYIGFVFGLASLIGIYIFYGLISIFRLSKFYWLNPIIAALAILPWWFLADQTAVLDNFFPGLGRSVIAGISVPLVFTVSTCLGLCAAWFLIAVVLSVKNRRRKA